MIENVYHRENEKNRDTGLSTKSFFKLRFFQRMIIIITVSTRYQRMELVLNLWRNNCLMSIWMKQGPNFLIVNLIQFLLVVIPNILKIV